MPNTENELPRIPTLDGWRGIAILLVIFDHLQLGVSGGRTPMGHTGIHGVTLFFVLSGYLITARLMQERETKGRVSLREFYMRRFFRIMPAAWFYLLVISLVTWNLPHQLLSCLLFYRNYVGSAELTAHFWSLSIEEQYYLIWPLLLWLLGRRSLPIAATGACLVALNRAIHWRYLAILPFGATLGTELRIDSILVGCCAALLLPWLRSRLRVWMIWPLLAIFAGCLTISTHLLPFSECVVIALLLCVTSSFPTKFRWLSNKPIVYVGALSYSLYLWQQPTLRFGGHESLSSIPLRIGAMCVCAILSYTFIEQPCIRLGRRILQNRAESVHEFSSV
jgi:peptidoglycan/LPS O-acetylase OafA/YrhL